MNMWVEVCCGWTCWAEGRDKERGRRFMDKVRKDRKPVVVREDGAGDDRVWWRLIIGWGQSWREQCCCFHTASSILADEAKSVFAFWLGWIIEWSATNNLLFSPALPQHTETCKTHLLRQPLQCRRISNSLCGPGVNETTYAEQRVHRLTHLIFPDILFMRKAECAESLQSIHLTDVLLNAVSKGPASLPSPSFISYFLWIFSFDPISDLH